MEDERYMYTATKVMTTSKEQKVYRDNWWWFGKKTPVFSEVFNSQSGRHDHQFERIAVLKKEHTQYAWVNNHSCMYALSLTFTIIIYGESTFSLSGTIRESKPMSMSVKTLRS